MKVVSFTDQLELDFNGNVLKNAICLGDVDNDGLNELIVGNDKGDLAIFKGDSIKPIYFAKALGMISAIAVGDILNIVRNVLIVITACGQCYVYDIEKEPLGEISNKALVPSHTQQIPANVKVILIGDINGDGFSEMIVGLTDRVVRTYRWVHTSDTISEKPVGKFVGLNKWEFAEQIGTITINKSSDGKSSIIVSQPSGTFITLKVDPQYHNQSDEPLDESSGAFLTKVSLTLEPLAASKLRNSAICGNIHCNKEIGGKSSLFAVATLDGDVLLVKDGEILWHHKINHALFAINSLDINNDGFDEIITCSWDGYSFIINHKKDCVQYAFHEPVCTFTAGKLGLKMKQVPCLVYVTFNNKIFVYYDISVKCLNTNSISILMKDNAEYNNLVTSLGIDLSDSEKLRELNKYALYGYHKPIIQS